MQQQQSVLMSAPVGAVPAGSAMVCMPFQTGSKTYDLYKRKQSIGLGATQIIIGILCIIFNSICLILSDDPRDDVGAVGHGHWCGILFTITGIFGVLAGKKRARCQIVAFMVLCIISAVFTIALFILASVGALSAQNYMYIFECRSYSYGDSANSYSYYRKPPCNVSNYEVIVVMQLLMAICGLMEAIVAIWGSAMCCRSGICCCSRPMMVLSSAGYLPLTEEMISNSQTQGGQYVYAPQDTTAPPAYVQPGWAMQTTNNGERSSAWPSSPSIFGQPGTTALNNSAFNNQPRFFGSGLKSDQGKC